MKLSILLVLAIPLSASAYEKNLDWVFADLKRPVAGLEGSLDATNYRAVLDGLKNNLHCNGLRLAIDLSIANPLDYPQLYRDVVAWAHAESMVIYANPLDTGKHGLSQAQLVARVTRYANYFKPRFLGPFNESNYNPKEMESIVRLVRSGLRYEPEIVGPDVIHVRDTIKKIQRAGLRSQLDIVGAHNAVKDEGATPWAWWKLRSAAGKETWATENPRPWSVLNGDGEEIGEREEPRPPAKQQGQR